MKLDGEGLRPLVDADRALRRLRDEVPLTEDQRQRFDGALEGMAGTRNTLEQTLADLRNMTARPA